MEFLYDAASGAISNQISGTGFMAFYQVALSLDGRHLLASVPPGGLGQVMIYPKPSLLAFVQSDQQAMWGRCCPSCGKYFRTNHIMDTTYCPYCSQPAPDLAFITEEQKKYLTAFYDAFARAHLQQTNTSLEMAEITDATSNWHYSEEKQQRHFTCQADKCGAQTDILGEYGYCPRCGRTNARKLFSGLFDQELGRLEEVRSTVADRRERGAVWEKMTVDAVSRLEALGKHLRRRLLGYPLTVVRRKQLEKLSFQQPLVADASLQEWYGMGLFEWLGSDTNPRRVVAQSEIPFLRKMVQRRHILIHNGGVVDRDYLELSGDTHVRLDERIEIRSNEAKRFLENVKEMGLNLLDNVEDGFSVGGD
ncbi:MAG: hypothetical protein ABR865_01705 [Terracidiphilus sp.]